MSTGCTICSQRKIFTRIHINKTKKHFVDRKSRGPSTLPCTTPLISCFWLEMTEHILTAAYYVYILRRHSNMWDLLICQVGVDWLSWQPIITAHRCRINCVFPALLPRGDHAPRRWRHLPCCRHFRWHHRLLPVQSASPTGAFWEWAVRAACVWRNRTNHKHKHYLTHKQ